MFKLRSTKLILQNGFHHDYVRQINRKYDALSLTAMTTADVEGLKQREKKQMFEDTKELLGKLEILGEEVIEPTTA
ncbi:MAG: hypothetical protein ACFFC7_24690 [Candidatus Hermodarchaeota archaeon]